MRAAPTPQGLILLEAMSRLRLLLSEETRTDLSSSIIGAVLDLGQTWLASFAATGLCRRRPRSIRTLSRDADACDLWERGE
jgi:hypothetical protein